VSSAIASLPRPIDVQAAPRPSAGGGRLPLEERLARTLQEACASDEPECPVCSAPMHGVGHVARCSGCGSSLS
jgi:tRNA(Ile2) C34 agmatinyltransferase TiaS